MRVSIPTLLQRFAIVACLGLAALTTATAEPLDSDILYIGDGGDNSVKRFDATTAAPLDGKNGKFATSGLHGPRGLLVAGGQLVVVDQNAGKNVGGEILQFRLSNGRFTGAIVQKNDPNGPFAPRGAVLANGLLYVTNFVDDATNSPGQVLVYSGDGKFQGELVPPPGVPFHPRGVVVGPDGLLYVSSCPNFDANGPTIGGQVLKFDPTTLEFQATLIDDAGGVGRLNRPEGLVFGPDGNLYVTSFRQNAPAPADPSLPPNPPIDVDSIRIYDGASGAFLDKIDLNNLSDVIANPRVRAAAQALLFGPGGKLFVPITTTGVVRRYDVSMQTFEIFLPAGRLIAPWFLTFGRTNAATLAYDE